MKEEQEKHSLVACECSLGSPNFQALSTIDDEQNKWLSLLFKRPF